MQHDNEFTAHLLIRQLTSLRPKGPISEALLSRRLRSLPDTARAALACSLDLEAARRGAPRVSRDVFKGVVRALVEFPGATACEVARVQKAGAVMSRAARDKLEQQRSHLARLAHEGVQRHQHSGQLIHPISYDRWCIAQSAMQRSTVGEDVLSELCDLPVRRSEGGGCLVSKHGIVMAAPIAMIVLESESPGIVLCQSCLRPIMGFKDAVCCQNCYDFVCCVECSNDIGAQDAHGLQCSRSQAIVRQACEEMKPHLGRASITQVTVMEPVKGLILPVETSCASTTDASSSMLDSLLWSHSNIAAELATVYQRLAMKFLAETDLQHQPATHSGKPTFERVLEKIMEVHASAVKRCPRLEEPDRSAKTSKSALRRQRMQRELRAQRVARAAAAQAEAVRQREESDRVLTLQTSQARDSSTLSSVLERRRALASPEIVELARKRRDELLAAERKARRRTGKTSNPDECLAPDIEVAAACRIQRQLRYWRRRRRKAVRVRRCRAAKRIQTAARQWLSQCRRDARAATVGTSVLHAAENSTPEAEDPSCVVCLERPRSVVMMPCRHLCMCKLCAAGLSNCPICRGTVYDMLVVFV